MFDPGEVDAGQIEPTSHPIQKGCSPAVPKGTVKELLMLKRHACSTEQKWTCLQADGALQTKFKRPKFEASGFSMQFLGPQHCSVQLTATGNMSPLQQMHHPTGFLALLGPEATSSHPQKTLFHWQIKREEQKVQHLSMEQLNMQDADGDTFLHIAVAQGKRALAYVLAAKLAECGTLDVKEHNGQTALQLAVATDQHLITLDLLKHGAQVDTRDLWGRSPLHVCAEKGHLHSLQSIWRFLTESGLQINTEVLNYDGLTPLHAAVLSHNAIIKEMRSVKNPCMYISTELGKRKQMHVDCINTLLLMGAACETRDQKSGRTCLHMACEEANMELLNIFLNQPSTLSIVNAQTFSGNTALHIVSSLQGHNTQLEAVKLLMRRGADPGARNLENELPLQLTPNGQPGEKVRKTLKGKYEIA